MTKMSPTRGNSGAAGGAGCCERKYLINFGKKKSCRFLCLGFEGGHLEDVSLESVDQCSGLVRVEPEEENEIHLRIYFNLQTRT